MLLILWLRGKMVLAATSCAILSVLAFVSCLGVAVMGVLGVAVGFATSTMLGMMRVQPLTDDWIARIIGASAVVCIAWGQLKIFQDSGMRVLWRDLARCILLLIGCRAATQPQVLERGAQSSRENIHA